MARVTTDIDRLAEADANRTTERNRTAALKLAAFALEQDRPEQWLRHQLDILGLLDVVELPPGICHRAGCDHELATAQSPKIPYGFCSHACHRAHEEATS